MYKVKTATVETQPEEYGSIEEAMNVAATYMKSSPDAVSLVMDDENGEAVTVLHNHWAYLATEKPA